MGLSTNAPVASGPILPDPSWWIQRDFTRKYHAQVVQQELAFRAKLSHLYASSSRPELLHQEFGKNPNQIFQQENGKNLQQNGSKSPDSVLLKQPGWSSSCEVDSKTEVLEKCNFVDKEVLMSKELKGGSDNGREEKSEQQKTQTEQQQQERDISDDLEEQEKSMKNDTIPFNDCQRSLNSNQSTTDDCLTCNKVFKSQKDFETHLAGRKHAKQLSQRLVCFKDLSEVKDGRKKCENDSDSRLQKYGKNLLQNSSKSPDPVLPKQPGWSSFCEVDSKTEVLEKCNFIDKEVLMSKELKEGSDNGSEEKSEQQKTQTEQQQQERDISDDLEKQEKSMKNGSIPFSECQRSLDSNQLTTDECLTCNKVFKSQKDFESHLAGRKHAKQLSQRLICFEDLSEFNDSSKKCENAGDSRLQEYGKKLQQNSSKFPNSVLPKQPGRSSFCEVDSKTEVLEKCNFIDNEVLMSKALKEGDNGSEEKSEQHKTETEQQQQERDISDDLEKQEKSMKNDSIPFSECRRSLNSNQLTTDECLTCNKVFKSQKDFESHLAGRKHAKKSLQRITCAKALSEVRDDSKHCENAGEKILISIDSGLAVKDNVEKRLEKELVEKVKYNGDMVAKEDKVGMKENAELNEQQQIMVGVMPSKPCKWSSNLSELSIKNCKIFRVKCDEQKSSENKHVLKVKDDKDLGVKINEVDMKEKTELIDQHQMKEGNSKQQIVQIEQQMAEGNSEQQMMERGTPSLKSNQLRTEEFLTCNKVFKSQKDFESHLAGRKHAKQLLQRITCVKALSEVKDDSKKCENAGEKLLISIDCGLMVKDNVEKRLEKELDEKVKYNGDLVAKEDKVGIKGNAVLNEQQRMMVGAMPSKVCKKSSNLHYLSIKNCNISHVKGDEQKSAENKPFWKPKDDKYLGAEINKIDMKKNVEVIDQDQMKEGNSKQQKVQIEQQMMEGNSKQQNPQMEQQMMQGGTSSLKSNQLRTEECVACNKVFNSQDDFESRLAGRKQGKQLLQTIKCVEALSEIKGDSMKCENAGEKILISTDSGLLVKDNMEKRLEKELVEKVKLKYDGVLVTKEEKVSVKENAELNERQKIMVGSLPSKLCKRSSNLNELSIKNCKISYVKCDEQKSYENKSVWKAKDDKYLGAKINKVDMKENAELIDQHQMEGNSKQQKVQIEQQMTEGNSKQQNPQMEQQMMQGGTPSLKSNQLRTEERVTWNKVFNSQDVLETHLAGRKHTKQLLQTIKCVKALSEVKDDSKKCENAGEKILNSTDSGLLVMDNMEERLEKELVETVKYDGVLVAKEKVGVKKNVELNEQQQIMVGSLPFKLCKRSSNLNELSIKNCKISYVKSKCDEQKSYENKCVWKAKDDKDLGAKINEVDMKENTELIDQHQMKEGNSKQQKVQIEQQLTEGNSKKQKPQMEQQMMEDGTTFKEYGGSLNSNPLKFKECVTLNTALKIQGIFEAHLSGRKHAKQLKETDEHELEQMNTSGVSSKVCKIVSNARQFNIEACSISKENDDVNRSDKNKHVWKVKDDRNLDGKRNRVDMKESAEVNEQCPIKEGDSEQQNFQCEQKMKEGKSKQQKLQMEQQMKGVSKTQKLQMKQQILENGLKNKQHEGLTSEQLKVNGYVICNTVLNFHGDSEAELARRKHAKQSKKMENKTVWKVTDKRHLCSKSDNFLMNETTELSEKQHMKETAELSEKQHMEGMKETAELSEKQHMKEDCMPSRVCKNSSNASQLSINEFKIPITKDKVDKGAINQSVRKVNEQQWMRKTNTKQQKLQTEQQLQEKNN